MAKWLIIILLSICSELSAQGFYYKHYDVQSESAFGKTHGMVLTYDSCYAFSIVHNDNVNNLHTIDLIKVNSSGTPIWRRSYNAGSYVDYPKLAEGADSGLVLTATFEPFINSQPVTKLLLIKTDYSGITQWVKLLGTDSMSHLNRALYANNEIVVLTSGDISLGSNQYESAYFVSKLDLNGNLIWYKKYNWVGHPYPKTLIVQQNEITIAGEIVNNGSEQMAVSRLDQNGNLIWSKIYQPAFDVDPLNGLINANGEIILAGRTSFIPSIYKQLEIFLLSLTPDGDFNWMKSYGGTLNDEGYYVFPRQNGYMIGAEPESFGNTSRAALMATDVSGNLQWMRLYGDSLGSFPNGMVQVNNGIVIYGIQGSFGSTAPVYILNVDVNGNACQSYSVTLPDSSLQLSAIDTGYSDNINGIADFTLIESDQPIVEFNACVHDNIETAESKIALYPNLSSNTIAYQLPGNPELIEVFDVCGKLVLVLSIQHANIDVSSLRPGVYLLEIVTKTNRYRQRFVKM